MIRRFTAYHIPVILYPQFKDTLILFDRIKNINLPNLPIPQIFRSFEISTLVIFTLYIDYSINLSFQSIERNECIKER